MTFILRLVWCPNSRRIKPINYFTSKYCEHPVLSLVPVAYRGEAGWGLGCSTTPQPPTFRRPSKIVPNSIRLWKLLKIVEFRTPTPQDVWKKDSKILKLPSVCNCFTLALTNKLVVIINSLKVPKIKKVLLYEMKFLVPNYSCLQNPWLGGYRPQTPEQKSWIRHWLMLPNVMASRGDSKESALNYRAEVQSCQDYLWFTNC